MHSEEPLGLTADKPHSSATAKFVFAIPVKPKGITARWDLVSSNLARTIRSILAGVNQDFAIYICGHEQPCPEFADSRVRFVQATFDFGPELERALQDKWRKLCLIGSTLMAEGYDDFYLMFLDADDLIHRKLVEHVLATDNKRSYLIRDGYKLDTVTGRLMLQEENFDRSCGSTFVGWFENCDLPPQDTDRDSYFRKFMPHKSRAVEAALRGRPPDPVPFPAVVYPVNHMESLQWRRRGGGLVRLPERRVIPSATAQRIIEDDFSLDLNSDD
ncbi:MAG TPA: hypothetical protein VIM02_11860 [Rhizomicrobium sp.]|jgi:hypothetical protein